MCVATFKCSWFQRPFLSLSKFPRCFDRWGKFLCDDSIHSCALTEGARSYVIGDKLPCPSAAFQPYPNFFLFFKKFWHTELTSILRLSNPRFFSIILLYLKPKKVLFECLIPRHTFLHWKSSLITVDVFILRFLSKCFFLYKIWTQKFLVFKTNFYT